MIKMIKTSLVFFLLAALLSGCGSAQLSHNSNEAYSKSDLKEILEPPKSPNIALESATLVRDFKFPFTISCLLKNKSDPTIAIAYILIVEEQRAAASDMSPYTFDKIANGIYKRTAIFSTSTLDIHSMTISNTGADSSVYGECRPLN